MSNVVSMAEAEAWAELVRCHWERTKRNPSQSEVDAMVAAARAMVAAGTPRPH